MFQEISGERVRIESKEMINIGPLVRLVEDLGAEVTEARRIRPSLEDVFVRVTGIELDAMKKEKGASNR
jgi:ABC-2 type transport system ATP-binding protein